jgi:hypothetical protein
VTQLQKVNGVTDTSAWGRALSNDENFKAAIPSFYSNVSLEKGLEYLRTVDSDSNNRVMHRSNGPLHVMTYI